MVRVRICQDLAIITFNEEERIALFKNQFAPLLDAEQILKKTVEDLIKNLTSN